MARSRVHRRKSHHKRKGSKRHRTRRHRSRRMRGGDGKLNEKCRWNSNTLENECDAYLRCESNKCVSINKDKSTNNDTASRYQIF